MELLLEQSILIQKVVNLLLQDMGIWRMTKKQTNKQTNKKPSQDSIGKEEGTG